MKTKKKKEIREKEKKTQSNHLKRVIQMKKKRQRHYSGENKTIKQIKKHYHRI